MSNLIISGVIDGPLSGGVPKAIELYVTADIADLSIYGIGSANNGGGTDGQEFRLSGSASAGDYIYIASENTGFESFFGFAPDFINSAANINGDDAIELFQNDVVVDVFGDINVDGTDEPWEYLDGWAYRNNGATPSTTFDIKDWSFSGTNALDGETTNANAVNPLPARTFECFLTGTLIATGKGNCTVEDLKIGDRVRTADGKFETIKWIGFQTFTAENAHPFRAYPIQIKAGALGNNLPLRDLFVTPDHALLVDGILVNAGALTNGISIVQVKPEEETFTYYHIELAHHALLLAEGTPAESFIPQAVEGRDRFDNAEEHAELYPNSEAVIHMPMSYPHVKAKQQLPSFITKRLHQIALNLYDVTQLTA